MNLTSTKSLITAASLDHKGDDAPYVQVFLPGMGIACQDFVKASLDRSINGKVKKRSKGPAQHLQECSEFGAVAILAWTFQLVSKVVAVAFTIEGAKASAGNGGALVATSSITSNNNSAILMPLALLVLRGARWGRELGDVEVDAETFVESLDFRMQWRNASIPETSRPTVSLFGRGVVEGGLAKVGVSTTVTRDVDGRLGGIHRAPATNGRAASSPGGPLIGGDPPFEDEAESVFPLVVQFGARQELGGGQVVDASFSSGHIFAARDQGQDGLPDPFTHLVLVPSLQGVTEAELAR